MKTKIDLALEYYAVKQNEILKFVNNSNSLSIDDIIKCGEEMAVIENKMTALEVALES